MQTPKLKTSTFSVYSLLLYISGAMYMKEPVRPLMSPLACVGS